MFASMPFFGFPGAGAAVVAPLAGAALEGFHVSGSASAAVTFNADGNIDTFQSVLGAALGVARWYAPVQAGIGSGYWIRATVTAGPAPTSGSVATWLQLNTAREWQNLVTPNAVRDTTLLIEISTSASSAGVVTSGTYQLIADADLR